MPVTVASDGVIMLEGDCPPEDAETVARLLLLEPDATVDWRGCESAHTAVVQVLLAARPAMIGPPRSSFLSDWVAPALTGTPA